MKVTVNADGRSITADTDEEGLTTERLLEMVAKTVKAWEQPEVADPKKPGQTFGFGAQGTS